MSTATDSINASNLPVTVEEALSEKFSNLEARRNSTFWEINFPTDEIGIGHTVASVWGHAVGSEEDQAKLAHLLASAHELREALKSVMENPCPQTCAMARKALAKSEGKTI